MRMARRSCRFTSRSAVRRRPETRGLRRPSATAANAESLRALPEMARPSCPCKRHWSRAQQTMMSPMSLFGEGSSMQPSRSTPMPLGSNPSADAKANLYAAQETENIAAQPTEISLRQTRRGAKFSLVNNFNFRVSYCNTASCHGNLKAGGGS